MSDVRTHLETIRKIDSAGHDRSRERAQALEHVAGAVADAMLEGRPVPVYCSVEGFFHTEGFDQAVAAQLVVRHATLIEQRAKLAKRLETAGVAYGAEAAGILRAMNKEPNFKDIAARLGLPTADETKAEMVRIRSDLTRLELAAHQKIAVRAAWMGGVEVVLKRSADV